MFNWSCSNWWVGGWRGTPAPKCQGDLFTSRDQGMVNGDGVDENDYDDYEYEDHDDDVVKGRK